MKKELIALKLEYIKESIGNSNPQLKQLCDSILETMPRYNTFDIVYTTLEELSKYSFIDAVKESIDEINALFEQNKIQLLIERTINILGQSASKINEAIIVKLKDIDTSNIRTVIDKMSSYSFNPAIKTLLTICESMDTEVKKIEYSEDAIVVMNQLSALKNSVNENLLSLEVLPKFFKILENAKRDLKFKHPAVVLHSVTESLKSLNHSSNAIYSFIEEAAHVLTNNKNLISTNLLLEELRNSKNPEIYKGAIDLLTNAIARGEEYLGEHIAKDLSGYTWIPAVKTFVSKKVNELLQSQIAENLNTGNKNLQEVLILPVAHDKFHMFTKIGENYYQYKDENLLPTTEVSESIKQTLTYLSSILETFNTVVESEVVTFAFDKLKIKVSENEVQTYLGEHLIEDKEQIYAAIQYVAKNNTVFRMAKHIIENKASDFVLTTNNVFSFKDGIKTSYLVKNETSLYENAALIENIGEYAEELYVSTGVDIRDLVIEHVSNQYKVNKLIKDKLDETEEMVKFLKEQLNKIISSGVKSNSLFELSLQIKESLSYYSNVLEELKKLDAANTCKLLQENTEKKDVIKESCHSVEEACDHVFQIAKTYKEDELDDKMLENVVQKIKETFNDSMLKEEIKKMVESCVVKK